MSTLQTVENRKTYGLIPKKTVTQPQKRVLKSIFSSLENDDCEEQPLNDIERVNKRLREANTRKNEEAEKAQAQALTEDSSIFDYDGAYDSFKSKECERQISAKTSGPVIKPRYIEKLKSTAEIREKEKERIYERRLLKERKAEDELFPETEKFVTRAYKEKMMEAQQYVVCE